jgi:chemotaxis protein MotB
MRKRRAGRDDPENTDRWIISYADFVTLLFAFFTTMYAISAVDSKKLDQFVGSMRQAFRSEKSIVVSQIIPDLVASATMGEDEVQGDIEAAIGGSKLHAYVSVRQDFRGTIVSINSGVLFDDGSAELRDSAYEILEPIAMILKRYPNHISIEGHTDSIPPATDTLSNWDLSALRAVHVLKYLGKYFGLSSGRLSASGYAEFRPVADNATPEGRAKNRRVDIIILQKKYEKPVS